MKTRFWCYSIHGSVNDDPVRLLFCGDLTILLLGLIIYCLFKLKRKLRHSLRRPSRSDLVQFWFVDVENTLPVFPVDALYHLCLFRIDDEILICILGVAEEVIVIYLYLAILVAKLESQLHILTEGL